MGVSLLSAVVKLIFSTTRFQFLPLQYLQPILSFSFVASEEKRDLEQEFGLHKEVFRQLLQCRPSFSISGCCCVCLLCLSVVVMKRERKGKEERMERMEKEVGEVTLRGCKRNH